VHFLIRWKKGHHFLDEEGEEKSLGQIGKSKRSWGQRMIWDEKKKEERKTGIVALPVKHARYAGQLWVVIVRRGGEPWYLITNRCIETEEQAWECYKAYCRRWQVETVFPYEKSELALETIRIWKHDKRKKLLHMVSLVHSFLLHVLGQEHSELLEWLLRQYCHRTGNKQKEATVPLYRLRWAMSRLWQEIRPVFSFPASLQAQMVSHPGLNVRSQNSGELMYDSTVTRPPTLTVLS
jgi:hypothetical protein